MFKTILYISIFSCVLHAQQFKDFNTYQNKITYEKIKSNLEYTQKSISLLDHYTLSKTSLKIYASLQDKQQDNSEYELQLTSEIIPSPKQKKLSAMRIAIDPGHIGGETCCFLESRYIYMDPKVVNGRDIRFHEGELAVLTALHLQELLEAKGAEVMLTKKRVGESVYHKDFFTWQREDFRSTIEEYVEKIENTDDRASQRSQWLTRSHLWSLFRKFYNPLDLKARADKINAFAPDMTIVIHYNVGAGNNESGQNIGSSDNYNMAFIPGSFLAGELKTKIGRYHFLRLLITNDLQNSLRLSSKVVKKFTQKLNVPPLENEQHADYLHKYCMSTTAPGVYARNLTLTRLVQGTMCYGESLYQDNIKESILLATKDDEIAGVKVSSRVRKVAEAYFEAIVDYCQ
ncbi:N-acetylmuramoyl-L-alanine amidase [Candidatus Uabimicrobium sp. HlEnr_7]|uniref:N-acetylmuramoyl-L-alanine amidase n=1 Tax=Candidatus Uabimicrobium helgolandensis TaxID=3095367 RepID=UPI003556D1C4